ncbi:MAG TPA: tetratricopeptide repeat protein, partial [Lacunisphaera sp.]|nr:tetratricopeptide repeat protein [Lacunisphaera sp.]
MISTGTTPSLPTAAIDPENPWLGLASFTEETRGYFHGREEETAELCRRVQRKLLTILFGQSGLGKTSILRAGIVPRLTPEGYCPVYVRLDYAPESPAPSEQIKRAVTEATKVSGRWTQRSDPAAGESLWEFFHHRGEELQDNAGKPLIPLLIFDQFEEVFTLAQGDEAGRQRAAAFLEELADLVENRPPKALEARMEEDEAGVEEFDFTRADYRVLISLREDYLAHLEGLKNMMPAVTQNRMRLARMTGTQALAAVTQPGGGLVSAEVAEQIVRFIAGGAELAGAEVEPSLLSLVCRELNNARRARGHDVITADLLAGSRETILSEFYERTLADQPAGVRAFIEDELLTDSGYRESIAASRVRKAFAAVGAPTALATLVDRRLLRVEERLDVRRVELTHDVLCGVVKSSRDVRLERESKIAVERQLAATQAQEQASRQALRRARLIAGVCACLAIGAVANAIFGFYNLRRAQAAEAQAQRTQQMAEGARSDAEKLIVYLLDDFYLELEPVGRLDIVAELARRALDYYRELAPELRTPETDRNRALALVRYGAVLRNQGRLDESQGVLNEAVGQLRQLHAAGDKSELTAIGLGLGLSSLARVHDSLNKYEESATLGLEAVAVVDPLMAVAEPSVPSRRAYGSVLNFVGVGHLRRNQEEQAVKTLEQAREVFRGINGLRLTDFSAAAAYAEVSATQLEALVALGRMDEAKKVGKEAAALAAQILEKRPGHLSALRARGLISGPMSSLAADDMLIREAMALSETSARDWEAILRIDPTNNAALSNLFYRRAAGHLMLARLGRPREAMERLRVLLDGLPKENLSAMTALSGSLTSARLAVLAADLGDRRQGAAALADSRRLAEAAIREMAPDSFDRAVTLESLEFASYAVPAATGDYKAVRGLAQAALQRLRQLKPKDEGQKLTLNKLFVDTHNVLADAAYRLKDFNGAEQELRSVLDYRRQLPKRTLQDLRDASNERIMLAMILAPLERRAEAWKMIEPDVAFHRELLARGADDMLQRLEVANVFFV